MRQFLRELFSAQGFEAQALHDGQAQPQAFAGIARMVGHLKQLLEQLALQFQCPE